MESCGWGLLGWPDCNLLWRWGGSMVELLLLLLLLLVLRAIAPILLLLRSAQLTPGGVYTMRYLGGASLEPPLAEDPGIILFLFFSSTSATAFIVLSIHCKTGWGTEPGGLAVGW
jgi:hypothetical protein